MSLFYQFLERAEEEIKFHEMTPYEHRQLRLKKEAEEKRIKEGKPPLEEKLGIEIVKHNEGTGGKPHIGARVKVHYTGKLTNG